MVLRSDRNQALATKGSRSISILLLDGSLLTRLGLRQLIFSEFRDPSVTEVRIVEEARAALSRDHFDILLADIGSLHNDISRALAPLVKDYPSVPVWP